MQINQFGHLSEKAYFKTSCQVYEMLSVGYLFSRKYLRMLTN